MANLTDPALNIIRTQNHYYEFAISGLLPNTKHSVTLDGVDHAFATKQKGKDFGADLISDANGQLRVGVLVELRFPRDQNFELPRRTTLQFQNEQLATESRQAVNITKNYRIFEFTSANGLSKAQFIMPLSTLLTAGPVSVLYPIE